MGAVKQAVSELVRMLNRRQKEAESRGETMHQLQSYLDEEPKNILQASLDRLLNTIKAEAVKITRGSVVVLVAPEGVVTVGYTHSDENSDSYLMRLKSQDFSILRPDSFSSLIQSLKSEVAEGNLIPVIEFLRANAKIEAAPAYSPAPALRESPPREPSSSGWKLSDFLPAGPPYPPLPRGLFKD